MRRRRIRRWRFPMQSIRSTSTMICASFMRIFLRICRRSSRMRRSAWSALWAVGRCRQTATCWAPTISRALFMCPRRRDFPSCASAKARELRRKRLHLSASSCLRSLPRRKICRGTRAARRSTMPCSRNAEASRKPGAVLSCPCRSLYGAPISHRIFRLMLQMTITKDFLPDIIRTSRAGKRTAGKIRSMRAAKVRSFLPGEIFPIPRESRSAAGRACIERRASGLPCRILRAIPDSSSAITVRSAPAARLRRRTSSSWKAS